MAEHKGFDPSHKKLQELRKKGQAFKSPLIAQTAAFLIILLCIFSMLQILWSNSTQMIEYCLSVPSSNLGTCGLKLLIFILIRALFIVGLSLLAASFVAIFFEFLQLKIEFHWSQLAPNFERLSLVAGLKRQLAALKLSLVILIKVGLITALIMHISQNSLQHLRFLLEDLSGTKIIEALSQIKNYLYLAGVGAILLALCERKICYKRFLNQHSMSLDEVRREHKQEEGDPYVKAYRRSIHEEMALQEIVKRVRSSAVIIVDD
jgi:flagellar biosynthesis protein FlhB